MQVSVLQGTARRIQVDAALSGTRRIPTLRPYADVLQVCSSVFATAGVPSRSAARRMLKPLL